VSLDLVVSLIFFFVQARLATVLWRRVQLYPAAWRSPARGALVLFGTLVAVGYACSFSEITGRLRLSGKIAPVCGALAVCYLLTSTGVLALYTVVQFIRKRLNANTDPERRRVLQIAGNAALAAPFAVLGYGALIKRTDFQVREVDVPLAGLPAALEGLTLLHLSDIHLSAFLSEEEFARVVDATRELRPHIAFATGDFISNFGDPLEACMRQLARVKSDAGMFGCLGNHEHYAAAEQSAVDLAAQRGIPILRGASRQLRFGDAIVNIAGVDYQPFFHKEKYLAGAERLLYPGALNVLLSHNPDVFPVAATKGFDLVLAGHTHGGQVTVEILDQGINPARFFTPYVKGLYGERGAAIYVTRGIGTIGIPARIGAAPEISVLRLRKA
jgi:predicted MPP superfamily phosphohydrolase